jgi:hypothetical protein
MRLAVLVCLLALPAFSQARQDRAKRVIDDALTALGGQGFLEMKDRVETGRGYAFAHENLSGLSRLKIYSRYLIRPEPPQPGFIGVRERQAQGKDEDIVLLFTETEAYETTFRGAKPVPAALYDRWREGLLHNVLYILRMRLGEPGLVIEDKGTSVFDNQPVDVVNIVDSDNRQVEVMFHQTTKLPVRQEWSHRDPKTKYLLREVTVFTKWRDVGGGVMWPYTLRRERNGERVTEIYAESVVINQGLTDDMFTLSGSTKVIEKKK